MFIMVDVLRKPDGNKPGMVPAVIARRKSFPEHDSDLVRLRMLLIMQNKIHARMLNSVTGFVFFAHGPSFQNGVGLGSPIPAHSAQPTAHDLRNFGPFSRPLPLPLAPPYGPNFADLFRRAGNHLGVERRTKFDLVINPNTAKTSD
jgi:hypothetical protein